LGEFEVSMMPKPEGGHVLVCGRDLEKDGRVRRILATMTPILVTFLFGSYAFASGSQCQEVFEPARPEPLEVPTTKAKRDDLSYFAPQQSLVAAVRAMDFLTQANINMLAQARRIFGNPNFVSFEFKTNFTRNSRWWVAGEWNDNIQFKVLFPENFTRQDHPGSIPNYAYPRRAPYPKYSVDLEVYDTNPQLIGSFLALINLSDLSPELKDRAAKTIGAGVPAGFGRFPFQFHEDHAASIVLSIVDQLRAPK